MHYIETTNKLSTKVTYSLQLKPVGATFSTISGLLRDLFARATSHCGRDTRRPGAPRCRAGARAGACGGRC